MNKHRGVTAPVYFLLPKSFVKIISHSEECSRHERDVRRLAELAGEGVDCYEGDGGSTYSPHHRF